MIQLTDEQRQVIEQMAELFFTPEEVCKNLELDFEEMYPQFELPDSPVHKAFEKGWLKGDITLRKGISLAAANGSSPAQLMMRQLQEKAVTRRK